METTTLFIYILEFIVVAIALIVLSRTAKTYVRNKKLFVKTPKVRGRNWLIHPTEGGMMGIGIEPRGIGKSTLLMQLRTGHTVKMPVNNDDIYPENPVHAFAGNTFSVWRFRGKYYPDGMVEKEKAQLESELMEKAEDVERVKLIKKVEVNEAATLKDTVIDIFKELKEQKTGEVVIKK